MGIAWGEWPLHRVGVPGVFGMLFVKKRKNTSGITSVDVFLGFHRTRPWVPIDENVIEFQPLTVSHHEEFNLS